ncbi:hypothetical protein [Dyella sp. ASV21]|jgi:hypothetical protein|uniref:hypothetical protein n=1 Tax=Dyella sp. ASV21 TaxID=2795114 RepID=UPI0018EBB8D4|nr:hypothetical protein [Dyella sp. ASV21]
MLLKVRGQGARTDGFALWRILVWLMLLLAAFGCLQNALHAEQLWDALQGHATLNADATSQLHRMLAWDVGYFSAGFAVVVICAGVILHQGWARPAMQVAALALAVAWGLYGGFHALAQWREFSNAITLTNAQTPLDVASQAAFDHVQRTVMVSLALRALAVPVLLWLAWRLGRPAVRAQFRPRSLRR